METKVHKWENIPKILGLSKKKRLGNTDQIQSILINKKK